MNRVIGRSVILMILVVALTGGMFVFVLDYFANSDDWVMSEGSPHVYTDYSSVSGLITDRNGVLLMDTTNGRVYAQNELLRKSIIHRPASLPCSAERQSWHSAWYPLP